MGVDGSRIEADPERGSESDPARPRSLRCSAVRRVDLFQV
ncbi:MAG: hypothetical protein BIP78_1138 [Candidatus Bipolaricaulis sibiricus]|uniref:Uncharacterized protein n=1 Tax=Bipolaricaulis sibiricus TaxID=2501609 RepID=A0A410FV74_BIPS1|nr:MAG: hypothetical protein BIP78_1138 [Candidatus Bipolaricaulis sibiricus]